MVGIIGGHAPLLVQLAIAPLRMQLEDGAWLVARSSTAASSHVSSDEGVTRADVLAANAELADQIDVAAARARLEERAARERPPTTSVAAAEVAKAERAHRRRRLGARRAGSSVYHRAMDRLSRHRWRAPRRIRPGLRREELRAQARWPPRCWRPGEASCATCRGSATAPSWRELLEHFGVRRSSSATATAVLDATEVDARSRRRTTSWGRCARRSSCSGRCSPAPGALASRCPAATRSARDRSSCTSADSSGWARPCAPSTASCVAEAPSLRGASITLDYPSVTATENLLLAAVLAQRHHRDRQRGARARDRRRRPTFLVSMGAEVQGAGSSTIAIDGVDELRPADHDAVPDRIEAGTWAAAAVATQGDVTIENARPEHLDLFLTKLGGRRRGGLASAARGCASGSTDSARALDFVTLPYPGIATDFQPILLAMLAVADGTSIATENVFEGRFTYIGELQRMGADISPEGTTP